MEKEPMISINGFCYITLLTASAAIVTNDWQYRRTISLKPAIVEADTVVKVTLTPEVMGKPYLNMTADGSDLRFTAPDGKTLLNYWVESWDNNGTSKVWVKVPDVGTDKIIMYYGNPNAKSLSDGEGVFDFFDDFDNGLWTKPVDYPIYTPSMDRDYPDAGRKLRANLCEPSVIFEDGVFKMWYSAEELPFGASKKLPNGMAYATSKDGIHWERYPKHPIRINLRV